MMPMDMTAHDSLKRSQPGSVFTLSPTNETKGQANRQAGIRKDRASFIVAPAHWAGYP